MEEEEEEEEEAGSEEVVSLAVEFEESGPSDVDETEVEGEGVEEVVVEEVVEEVEVVEVEVEEESEGVLDLSVNLAVSSGRWSSATAVGSYINLS